MLVVLQTTTHKLRLARSTDADIDVIATFVDFTNASPPVAKQPDVQLSAFNTAATGDILAAPAGTDRRVLKAASITNKDTVTSCDVTPLYDANGTTYTYPTFTLEPGESLEFLEGVGFFKLSEQRAASIYNASTADQGPGFAADTYLIDSDLFVGGRIKAGTIFRWKVHATKTAAGSATPIWIVRFGPAGAIGDTARCTLTSPAQTAAADTALWVVDAIVRASGAAGVVVAIVGCDHALDSTGFSTGNGAARATSAAFDLTPADLMVGLSVNGGSSASWTVQGVEAEAFHLAA